MTCQNDQRMTLENHTGQSLKTIGVKELPFNYNVAMPMYFRRKSVMPCRNMPSAQTLRCSIEKGSNDPF